MDISIEALAGPGSPPRAVFDVVALNRRFTGAAPRDVVQYALSRAQRPVLTTNFRPLSVALIHLVTRFHRDIPVLWIDHGFNTDTTLAHVEEVRRLLGLNLQVYRPAPAALRAWNGDSLPPIGSDAHARFTEAVKLAPFRRALEEWQPDVWFTGIREEQTSYRRTLGRFSAGPAGTCRVAPFFAWTEVDVEGYVYDHGLPDYEHYRDPTKGEDERECGLQTLA